MLCARTKQKRKWLRIISVLIEYVSHVALNSTNT